MSFSDQLSTTYFRSYLYNDTPSSLSYFFTLNNNRVIFTLRNLKLYMLVLSAKHFAKTSLPTSMFTERFSFLTTNRVIFRLRAALFSQSSLSSAGLERANWPRGKLERGGKKYSLNSRDTLDLMASFM